MPLRWVLCFLPLFLLAGCASVFQFKGKPLYDFSVGTTYPRGVFASVWTNTDTLFMPIGSIGDSSGRTWVATRKPLPDSLRINWKNADLEQHRVWIPMRTILPPIKAHQKYHITVLIHRGDSVSTEVRVIDRDECSHLHARSKAYSGPGPCAY